MNLKRLNKLINIVYPLISIAFIAVIWIILYKSAGSEFIFPSIENVIKKTVSYFYDGFFYKSLLNTLLRVIVSFLLSFVFACIFGILSYLFIPCRRIITPIISVMRAAPTIALMIILNLLAVKPKVSPIIVSFAVIFPMLYSSVLAALNSVDKKWIEMAKIYKVNKSKQFISMYVPAVLPYVIEEGGAALSFNIKLTVSAEIIANTYASLGGILQTANVYFDISGVMAITVITVLLSVILELTVKLFTKLFVFKRRKND